MRKEDGKREKEREDETKKYNNNSNAKSKNIWAEYSQQWVL